MGRRVFTLSFDDGVRQDARVIELLQKYGLKATFNLNSGLFGACLDLGPAQNHVRHERWRAEEVSGVYAGMEVAAHTCTHPDLKTLSRVRILEEVVGDLLRLSDLVGYEVVGMAYPGGPPNYNGEVVRVIRENTRVCYARGFRPTHRFDLPADFLTWHPTAHLLDPDLDRLLDNFAEAEGDAVCYLWAHSYEFDVHSAWDRAEQIFARLARSGGACQTNREVFCSFPPRDR